MTKQQLLPCLETTCGLLAELARENHPAAMPLREAWLIDLHLQGCLSAAEAATLGNVSEEQFRSWLQQRHNFHLLGTANQNGKTVPSAQAPEFSIVLPIYNEQENIPKLYNRVTDVLKSLGTYEIIFVNDGSIDDSPKVIRQLKENDSCVRLLNLSRNFGHQAAITAGIDRSRGQAVMLLDADLQDPPELLPLMIEKWREGFHVVYAVRQKRQENIFKRSAYFIFYRLLRMLAEIDIPLDSGDFCLMDRVVVEQLRQLPERNRFLRGLRSWVGFRQTSLLYERHARYLGEPKYTLKKLVKLALDGLIAFSSAPLRLAAYLGFSTSIAGLGYLCYALMARLFFGSVPQGWTSLVALILLLGGAQLVLLGVLGEYIARIYEECKQRPSYIVAECLD